MFLMIQVNFLSYANSLESSNLYIYIFSVIKEKVGALESNSLIYITAPHLLDQ